MRLRRDCGYSLPQENFPVFGRKPLGARSPDTPFAFAFNWRPANIGPRENCWNSSRGCLFTMHAQKTDARSRLRPYPSRAPGRCTGQRRGQCGCDRVDHLLHAPFRSLRLLSTLSGRDCIDASYSTVLRAGIASSRGLAPDLEGQIASLSVADGGRQVGEAQAEMGEGIAAHRSADRFRGETAAQIGGASRDEAWVPTASPSEARVR